MSRNNETKIKYLTQQEAYSLFKTIENTYTSHSLRDLVIFRIAYRCGLRVSEIALLKMQDYNASKGELYCRRLKGSNNNTLRLDSKTKYILDKYIFLSSSIFSVTFCKGEIRLLLNTGFII